MKNPLPGGVLLSALLLVFAHAYGQTDGFVEKRKAFLQSLEREEMAMDTVLSTRTKTRGRMYKLTVSYRIGSDTYQKELKARTYKTGIVYEKLSLKKNRNKYARHVRLDGKTLYAYTIENFLQRGVVGDKVYYNRPGGRPPTKWVPIYFHNKAPF